MIVTNLLAHGGTAGLAVEISLLVLPIIVFVALAMWSGRKARAAEAAEAAAAEQAGGGAPNGSGPADGEGRDG